MGTDSHEPLQLRFLEYALAAALLAGIKRKRILNFMPRDELLNGRQCSAQQLSNAGVFH